jgi:adenosylcobyric acid synthase
MAARALMFQGTGSDVGKSLVVAALARAFTVRGLSVLPFKPQNMSNNAAVTADGGEIGRAQALQARAAKVALSVHMNPVLLKPQSDIGAQVVVQGRVLCKAKAADYQDLKPTLMPRVLESFLHLKSRAELVLIEAQAVPRRSICDSTTLLTWALRVLPMCLSLWSVISTEEVSSPALRARSWSSILPILP